MLSKVFTFFVLALVFSTHFNIDHKWLFLSQVAFASLGFLGFFIRKPTRLLGLALPTITFFPYGTLSAFF